MRVLLDENLPRQLKRHFTAEVEVLTVQERGWSGIENSELLRLAAREFEVFLTCGETWPDRTRSLAFTCQTPPGLLEGPGRSTLDPGPVFSLRDIGHRDRLFLAIPPDVRRARLLHG